MNICELTPGCVTYGCSRNTDMIAVLSVLIYDLIKLTQNIEYFLGMTVSN